jgi:hypothetical protein
MIACRVKFVGGTRAGTTWIVGMPGGFQEHVDVPMPESVTSQMGVADCDGWLFERYRRLGQAQDGAELYLYLGRITRP